MIQLELQVIKSTQDPDLVSLRPLNRAATGLRRELTEAGFLPGDRVIMLRKEDYTRLIRKASHNDETVETGV